MLLTRHAIAKPPKMSPSRIAMTFRTNTGFRRTSGVVEEKRNMATGMSSVGKTVSMMRRSTMDPSSVWSAGGSIRGVNVGGSIIRDSISGSGEPLQYRLSAVLEYID